MGFIILFHIPFFRNSSYLSKRFLIIEDKYHRTSLHVYEPTIGLFDKSDILKHYELILERANIQDTIFASLFTYDCQMNVILYFYNHQNPPTNMLSTPNGEGFLLLWELKSCSDLPIFSTFNDEAIPSADELNEADKKGCSFLPKSCKSSKANKITYPFGSIDKSRIRYEKFIYPLKKLNIPPYIQDDVYLMTFLLCWLCKFVFLSKDVGFIHPSSSILH
ncbi:hypothetical protein POTOM_060765 [Populus tomentosa]|uniref:Uncharacterized protein n=1 Tax=Populus tomentosa TaxID=118781 RepID=A0A8X8C079_POPTO|nr:hypothetical protein POTOM_060765 [Populus tomentosa]